MQQAGLIYDLEDRKNTLDLSYINFDAKMNYSISYHIIREGIKKRPKTYRQGVSKNWKDSEPENLHVDHGVGDPGNAQKKFQSLEKFDVFLNF